jgi:glycosyltransferase involved in cell wall biosynthesis
LFGLWWLHNEFTHLIRPLRKIPRGDLYYIHCYEYFPIAWLRAKISAATIFYDSHDFYSEISTQEEITPFQQRWIMPFVRRSERRCFKRADCAVTVCEGLAALFEAKLGRRPYVLRNVHDKRLDRPPEKKIRHVLNLPSDAFLILTIGNAKEGQAISSVVEAAKKLPRYVHFAFLGKGYQSRLKKVGLTELKERFHFLEPVAPFEVVPLAAGANAALILYYPRSVNYHFALPNGFFQGMAAGLPTLYPDLPEIGRLAKKYELGLMIDVRNSDSISRAIEKLHNEPSLCKKLAANAEKAALELSWENEEIPLRSLIQRRLRLCNSALI